MTGAAVTYGDSLYDLAVEESIGRDLLDELTEIDRIFKENPTYIKLLDEPSLPRKERCGLIEQAFAGSNLYVKNFLKLLCEAGLLREFSGCVREFRRRWNEDNGILTATATCAAPLTDEQRDKLTAHLKEMSGHPIELTVKVDPACIGGMRLDLGGKRFDGTIRQRLDKIRSVLAVHEALS